MRDKKGRSALMFAREKGRDDVVRLLLRRMDEVDFERAKGNGTISAFEQYLRTHPSGAFRNQASGQIQELAYQNAATLLGTEAALASYLEQFPNSPRAVAAREKLDDLRFEKAKATNSPERWEQFLEHYADNARASEAQTLLEQSWLERARRESTAAAYAKFIDRWPTSNLASVASEELADLEKVELANGLKLIESNRIDPEGRGGWGETPLHNAVANEDSATARALLHLGAAVDAKIARTGVTPLHVAGHAGKPGPGPATGAGGG